MKDLNLNEYLELNERAKRDAKKYPHYRSLYRVLENQKGKHFTGISGPRGVGKTVLLKQMLCSLPNAFYLSLDVVPYGTDVFELIKKLHVDYKYSCFLLDEIHFQSGMPDVLKKLYDFLDIRVCFTSSVALALAESSYDLSRRALINNLYPFSYREYLFFKRGIRVSKLTFQQILKMEWTPDHVRSGAYFEDYLQGGLMPFSLDEPEVLPLLKNVLETVIMRDVPTVARLHVDELDTLKRLMAFVGRSGVDGINYTTLSKNLGITKYKAEQYIGLLEKAYILHAVFPKGTNLLKEPKILMALPYRLLFRAYDDCIGGLREDFFAEAMRQSDMPFSYLKSTRGSKTPDFLVDDDELRDIVIEVGGKGKGREQFKGIHTTRKIIFHHSDTCDKIRRPLFMLGYLT